MTKKFSKLIIILSFVLILAACSGGNEGGNSEFELGDPIASVNGVTLHEGPYERAVERILLGYQQQGITLDGENGETVKERVHKQILDQMIQIEVLTQEAQNLGFTPTDSEVQAELDSFKGQYGSDEEYNNALSENLFTEEEFRKIIFEDISVKTLFDEVVADVSVTEEEVEDYYLEIVQEAQQQLDALRADGQELTQEQIAMMAPPFFEEVQEDIYNQLMQQKTQEKQMEYVNKLMEDSEIEMLIEE